MFMQLARIYFSKAESILSTNQRRNNNKVLREVHKFEKLDYKVRKVQLGLDFLCECEDSDVIPNFLNFRFANKKVQDSLTYKNCLHNLLISEINLKELRLRVLKINSIFIIVNKKVF